MKRAIKVPVTYESNFSPEELEEKMLEENRKVSMSSNLKGREIFLWSIEGDRVQLKFYHSYHSDMCDTMFIGTLNKGLQGSQLDGFIKKPAGIWGVFWTILAVALLIGAGIVLAALMSVEIQAGLILLAPLVLAVAAFIGASMLRFDKQRLAQINDYMREFTESKSTDVLGEELAEDERN